TQTTDIEPAGMTPSTMTDDQDVNVTVTLPGGKSQMGYRKFVFAKGGMDEKHKMTVFSVEIDKVVNTFLPKGGSEDNEVQITARALPNDMKGQWVFELFDVSDENGFCMNAPSSLPFFPWSEDGRLFKDYQFPDQADFDTEGLFWTHTAKSKKNDISTATVRVKSFDYGGFGKIKADFKFMDETLTASEKNGTKGRMYTKIPLDDDDNDMADGWSGNVGGADDDKDNVPALGAINGDGLTRYQEYRGFMVMGRHTRTDPNNKDLFIWDQ